MKREKRDKKLEIKEKLIDKFKISEEIADELLLDYGMDVIKVIVDKPFILCHYAVKLEMVTEIIEKNSDNKSENYKNRDIVAAAIIYVIESASRFEGHTFCYKDKLTDKVKQLEPIEIDSIEEALELLKDINEIVIEEDSECRKCIFLVRLYNAEVELAKWIRYYVKENKVTNDLQLNKIKSFIEGYKHSSFKPNSIQQNAIEMALINRISVIWGMAGTGKTTVIKAITEGFKNILSEPKIHILSFTGKAVDELSKKTGFQGETIHSFLGIGLNGRNNNRNIKADVIIIDESGLIGLQLFNSLICSIKNNPEIRIVIVGDPFQLESIEPGNILIDFIESGVIPFIELKDIVRQHENSVIIENAHKIIKGIGYDGTREGLRLKKNESEFIQADGEKVKEKLIMIIDKLLKSGTSIYDIQIISPIRKAENGVEELNKEIAERFNNVSGREVNKFAVLDKVMQVKNSYKGNCNVFNGQVGKISITEEGLMGLECVVVDFGDKKIKYKCNELDEIEIAFATTVHKMQGSQSKIVIMVVDKDHEKMLSRELLYVGVTRAEQQIILVGDKETFNNAVKRKSKERHSLLAERIIETI